MNFFEVNLALQDMENIPFFRPENREYYITFFINNPDFTVEQIVLYVNIGLMYDFYERIEYVKDPLYYRVLVNKFNRSSAYFSPPDLTFVAEGQYLRDSAAQSFLTMQQEMYNLNLPIVARSTYRSYQTQRSLFENNVATMGQAWADTWNARPGHSEHQLGLAVDILQPGQAGVSLSGANFEYTPQYTWLLNNAHRFGFILRYPEAYTHITGYAYEPWHWRFVGYYTATYMYYNDIPTFDHYWATRIPYTPIPAYEYIHLDSYYTYEPYNQSIEIQYEPNEVQQNSGFISMPNINISAIHIISGLIIIVAIFFATIIILKIRSRNSIRLARQFDFYSRTPAYKAKKRRVRNYSFRQPRTRGSNRKFK